MILYHGSNMLVKEVDLQKSRPGKDFGSAFYLSSEEKQALEMAQYKVETFGGEIFVNRFEFDDNALLNREYKYMHFDGYTEEWARFILAKRNNKGRIIHDNDIVYGPIANDRIGRQIFNFNAGYIDFDTFIKRIQYPEGITFQWAFCTERSIQLLKYIE